MSDRFDTDPDDVLESEDQAGKQAERKYGTEPEAPSVDIPSAPEPPTPGADSEADFSDVDPEVRTLFWKLVFAVKFALLTLTLGALFVVFEENIALGGQLLAFGALLTVYTVYRYRESKRRLANDEVDAEDTEGVDS